MMITETIAHEGGIKVILNAMKEHESIALCRRKVVGPLRISLG